MENSLLSEEEQKILLSVARESIKTHLTGNKPVFRKVNHPLFLEKRGAFVTLKKNHELRGCIGTFTTEKTLYETIAEMAIAAATKDPRFYPLDLNELDTISIEISVLSELSLVKNISEIEVGKHGIYIVKGHRKGVLLPQVATDQMWDRKTFLEHTCIKAGLQPDEWKEGAEIYIFSAQIFGE
jgi:AmmeMemoRadiSam system protein A